MARSMFIPVALVAICVLPCGCGDSEPGASQVDDLPVLTADANDDNESVSIDELRRELGIGEEGEFSVIGGEIRSANLPSTDVADLSPLAGLPLQGLDISDTRVSDLSPLAGMPLEMLFAERTQVTDLTPLAGLPLTSLYLIETSVSDLSPLAGMSLEQLNLVSTQVEDLDPCRHISSIVILWLRDTLVTDLSPLKDVPITSLDVQETAVNDLTPLSGKQDLRRLNIADTDVADLTPLANLQLARLVFTPSKIETGIEAVRNMPSLRELGTQFEVQSDALPAAEFWRRYDAGEFADAPVADPEDPEPASADEVDSPEDPDVAE